MKRYFIITGTITYAIKGRDVLRRNGFNAEIKRAINLSGNVGCGYGIQTNCNPETAVSLFERSGVKYLQIKEE